jgi:hypothetical protein
VLRSEVLGGKYVGRGVWFFNFWNMGICSFPLKIKMLLIIVQSSSRSRIFILTVYSCPESCCRQGLPFVGNVLFEIVVSSKVLLKFLTRRRKLSIRTVELSKSSLVITSPVYSPRYIRHSRAVITYKGTSQIESFEISERILPEALRVRNCLHESNPFHPTQVSWQQMSPHALSPSRQTSRLITCRT